MATFTVTSGLDGGTGTLRDRISLANTTAGTATIVFNTATIGGTTITLTSDQLTIDGDINSSL